MDRRYFARLVDSAVLSIISVALFRLIGAGEHIPATLLILLVLWIGYGTAFESSQWGATLGKRWMGLRVFDSRGGRLPVPQAAARSLVKEAPFLILIFVPGGQLLSVIWLGVHLLALYRSPARLAIHDQITHTKLHPG